MEMIERSQISGSLSACRPLAQWTGTDGPACLNKT